MVDIVTNHMGYNGCGSCVDYSIYDAFPSVGCPPSSHFSSSTNIPSPLTSTTSVSLTTATSTQPTSKPAGKATTPSASPIYAPKTTTSAPFGSTGSSRSSPTTPSTASESTAPSTLRNHSTLRLNKLPECTPWEKSTTATLTTRSPFKR